MQHEFFWLAMTIFVTALMWVPYILNAIMVRGLLAVVGYDHETPLSPWAQRAKKAHYNAVENLVIFAPCVIMYKMLVQNTHQFSWLVMIYLVARVIHYVVYVLKVPLVRTLAFAAGWMVQVVLLCNILWTLTK